MKRLLLIVSFFIVCQLSFGQIFTIKLVDNLFNNSLLVGNDFLVKINNCSDTILNLGILDEIDSKRADFKQIYDLPTGSIINFACSPILDSSFLISIYNMLSKSESISHKICVSSNFIDKDNSIKIMYLRIFSRKGYKRYLRKAAKVKIGIDDISGKLTSRNLNSLFKNTSTYIFLSTTKTTKGINLLYSYRL